ncbi:hypothetical protein KEM54_001440 [Ascosphaera aggregata]|nr:hypothetical protein KEM54_001440 [Ascosphaera aggregata]
MESSPTKSPSTKTGLHVVWDCPTSSHDVVFVHGLDGHPFQTWTTTTTDSGSVFWPSDLLPESLETLPARILTYGYEASILSLTEGVAEDGLLQYGEGLAYELVSNREVSYER